MKLRNKKTGDIVEIYKIGLVWNKYGMPADIGQYDSLAELNKEWEDVPKESLIKDKDEKVREIVRAFSEVIQEKKHILVIKLPERGMAEFSNGSCFWMRLPLSNETMNALEDRTYYTITELCGEEEV